MDLKILKGNINDLKETLYSLMSSKQLTDESVVRCSQQLDKLLLEYQKQQKFV